MAKIEFDVAVLVGSLRKESLNKRLAAAIGHIAPPELSLRRVEIGDLPFYNGDLESDRPEAVRRFTAECARADAFLFVMPEYNRSVPAVLKNAIDWGSKPMDENVWRDKPALITGTSPGAIGTAVGQQHLRQILGILGASVMGGEAYLSFKPGLLDEDNRIQNDSTRAFLQAYLDQFASFVRRLQTK